MPYEDNPHITHLVKKHIHTGKAERLRSFLLFESVNERGHKAFSERLHGHTLVKYIAFQYNVFHNISLLTVLR